MHPPEADVPPASGPPEHVSSCAQVALAACEIDATPSGAGPGAGPFELVPQATALTTASAIPIQAVVRHVFMRNLSFRGAPVTDRESLRRRDPKRATPQTTNGEIHVSIFREL
jgi:hypothetical protein